MSSKKSPYDTDEAARVLAITLAKANPSKYREERAAACGQLRDLLMEAARKAGYHLAGKSADTLVVTAERDVSVNVNLVEDTLRLVPKLGPALPAVTLETLGIDFDPVSKCFVGPETTSLALGDPPARRDALLVVVEALTRTLQGERETPRR